MFLFCILSKALSSLEKFPIFFTFLVSFTAFVKSGARPPQSGNSRRGTYRQGPGSVPKETAAPFTQFPSPSRLPSHGDIEDSVLLPRLPGGPKSQMAIDLHRVRGGMNCQCLRPRIPQGIPEQCFSDSLPVPGRLHKKQGNMRSSAPQSQNTCKRPLLKGAGSRRGP